MDCKTFRSLVESGLINNALKKAFSEEIERHLQICAACRKRYASQKESTDEYDRVFPGATKTKAGSQSVEDLLDPFPDISPPIEFKDAPLTFTLVLDSREEEIKIVEPEVDFPLPKDGRLVGP